jgi:hypothetical protein
VGLKRVEAGKNAAAFVAGAFGYSREARLTMWPLTLPQVAATLAATRLLDEKMLNVVPVLLVVTSILGPLMTELFTPWLIKQEASTKAASMV